MVGKHPTLLSHAVNSSFIKISTLSYIYQSILLQSHITDSQAITDHFAIRHTVSLPSGPCGHLINAGYEYVVLDFTLPRHTLQGL